MAGNGPRAEPSPVAQAPPLWVQVYEHLRAEILGGGLEPGARLSVATLAASLGVSAMPVREALRVLGDDGLVESSARRWTRVATPDPGVALEVYPLLGVLEGLAVETGELPDRSRLAALRRANAELRTAGRKRDVVACLDADARFHASLVEGADNGTLLGTIESLKARVRLAESAYFRTESIQTTLEQHDEIVAALVAGKRRRAAAAVRRNWEVGLAWALEADER